MGFENLHCCADNMENQNDFGFTQRFKSAYQQQHLKQHCGHKQEIITRDDLRQSRAISPEKFAQNDQPQHQATKQTRPCLLQPESQELHQSAGEPALRQAIKQPVRGCINLIFNRGIMALFAHSLCIVLMETVQKCGEIVGNKINIVGEGGITLPDFTKIRFKIIRHNQNRAHACGLRHD